MAEQPSRKLTSSHQNARAQDEKIQIACASTKIPQCHGWNLWPFPNWQTQNHRNCLSNFAETQFRFMAYHSPKSVKCMRVSMELGILRFVEVNLTMPKRGQITRVCYRCLRTTKNPLNSVFMRVLLLTLGVTGYVCGGESGTRTPDLRIMIPSL